jgi:hypothetical protein
MVVEGCLSEEEGFTVFDLSTPPTVDRAEYESALHRARQAMGSDD